MKQQIWLSSKKKLYDLQYFEKTGIGRAVGPIPMRKGHASVGSVGTLLEVSGKSELEAFELLRFRIKENEER